MSKRVALRPNEWVLAVHFSYVAAISPWFPLLQWIALRPALLGVAAILLLFLLAYAESREQGTVFSMTRDWVPLLLTLFAYREMNWFTPLQRDYHLEMRWVEWDRALLNDWGLRRAIEWLGPLIPAHLLELCYLLVYAVGPFAVATLYVIHRRDLVNRILLLYLLGTLLSYALFPYFPSEPPRSIFSARDLPMAVPGLRQVNLWMLGGYGIHSSVFPSAHVSSAFSAAWALILFLPERKWIGRGMLIYAMSVALAVVYGRYHYAVDSLAGFGVSIFALLVGKILLATDSHR